jgi:hypothetical protein
MKSLFTKAGVAGFAGKVTGMMMGKAVNNIDAAMEAIANPQNFMSKALEAVKAKIEKVAGLNQIPYANHEVDFGGPISAKHAFANNMRAAYKKAREPDKPKVTDMKLKPA